MKFSTLLFLIFVSFVTLFSQTDEKKSVKVTSEEEFERLYGSKKAPMFNKITGDINEIYDIVISGNKIQTELWNYGSVCSPGASPNIRDLVWNNLGYGYEFGLIAGSRVQTINGDSVSIISDSHKAARDGDYSPDLSLKWGWLPKSGYADPAANTIASLNAPDSDGDGKPDSWPERWYSPGAGKYLWPAFLGDASTAPDEEVYYAIDDYTNYEFIKYYHPFDNDTSKAGLGLDADVRIIQFNNPLAEDLIFTIYQMTNASDKNLSNFYMGMFGDPHIGGATDNHGDDYAFFIPPKGTIAEDYNQRARSMVYAWDDEGYGMQRLKTGYFGWKFLESPSIITDFKDNDDDGIMNESPFNSKGEFIDGVIIPFNTGIDNEAKYTEVYGKPKARWSGDEDGDWDIEKNDIGIDGIGPESTNYPGKDYGEGDGFPSQAWYDDLNGNGLFDEDEAGTLTDEWSNGKKWAGSEPNFGFRDISESDQLGLTGFTVNPWDNVVPKEDDIIWTWVTKDSINPHQKALETGGDNIFCFSTGPMDLEKGESQRFSMVILFGEDLPDLLLNAETSVKILEADYQFAQPPEKPKVTAVSGDGKVTLFWDAKSEESIDPLTGEMDFEGYKIYRSRDYNFTDVYTITDANGNPYLGQALLDTRTGKRAQFDLKNGLKGLADVEYEGRGIRYYLGDDTGLVHEFVDSTVQNGVQYFYAVVAYDHGAVDLPPTETQSVIIQDAETGELIYDVNTLSVIPGPIGMGIVNADAGIGGIPTHISGNATGDIEVKVLDNLAVENKLYKVNFESAESYDVLDSTGVSYDFTSKGTTIVTLRHKHLVANSIIVKDESGTTVNPADYVVNTERGQIASSETLGLVKGNVYTISYRYYPIYQSILVNNEDGNDVFEGMRVFVNEDQLGANQDMSRFVTNSALTVVDSVIYPPGFGATFVKLRADWEIIWNNTDTTEDGSWKYPDTLSTVIGDVLAPFKINYVIEKEPNYRYEEPARFVLFEPFEGTNNNGKFDWGESVVLQPQDEAEAQNGTVSYQIKFSLRKNIVDHILPKEGDIYKLITDKPFEAGDSYLFETKQAEFNAQSVTKGLDEVYVVPNPYVAFSSSENAGRTLLKRGEREIQFRNLPPQCTIRIYTLTGELVDKIEKDDNGSIAYWNLLSSEGMRISYGVYIFHVDAPGIGEKIGRFGVIK